MKKKLTTFLLLFSIFLFSQEYNLHEDSITIENGFKAHFQESNFEKSEYIYNRLLKVDNKNPEIYFKRGRLYFSWKKYDLAISDFNNAVKYDYNDLANAYSLLGMSKMLLNNNPTKLCKDFKKAIKIDNTLSENSFYTNFCK